MNSKDARIDRPEADMGPGSACVWAGEQALSREGTQIAVERSVAFGYRDLDHWLNVAHGRSPGHIYSRNTNPTVDALEAKVRVLEAAPDSAAFSSGMAAISNTLFALVSPGERVVSLKDSYGGTSKLFLEVLPRFRIDVSLCETTDHDAIERTISAGCRVLYLESPTNPTLKVLDLARLAEAAHRVGALVLVDNTFATPINQNPLALGADLVLHSATKFLGGHADALGGVLCGGAELVRQVFNFLRSPARHLTPRRRI
jgi:cystathionine gamma-synthase